MAWLWSDQGNLSVFSLEEVDGPLNSCAYLAYDPYQRPSFCPDLPRCNDGSISQRFYSCFQFVFPLSPFPVTL
jgi:hypothetical protein